jgi:hypothetical protein
VFPVRYEMNSYILIIRNSVLKGLKSYLPKVNLTGLVWRSFCYHVMELLHRLVASMVVTNIWILSFLPHSLLFRNLP